MNLRRDRKQAPIHLFPSMTEHHKPIASGFGEFDFVTKGRHLAGKEKASAQTLTAAIEWETGNISSSHRSMNKLAIALEKSIIQIGVLIVPSRALYEHLTDRIGNIDELSGYLDMWRAFGAAISCGLLAISVVEHDHLTDDKTIPYLEAGNDGRAAQGRGAIRS